MAILHCPECKSPLEWAAKLCCHECGIGPIDPVLAERVEMDDKIRGLLVAMPSELAEQAVLFRYLALFKSRKKDRILPLQPRTELRLLSELWQLFRSHQLDPAVTADAIEVMLVQDLDLPLDGHNYLLKVAKSMKKKGKGQVAALNTKIAAVADGYNRSPFGG